MPLPEGLACPAALALAFSFTRGGAGYARSPQPLPVGTRSDSSLPGPSTCAANAVDVMRQSTPAAPKNDWISLCMETLQMSCVFARMDHWAGEAPSGQHRPKPRNLPQIPGASQSVADERRLETVRR